MSIDIDSLTIGEARKLAAMFGAAPAPPPPAPNIGAVVLLRTFAAGVWIGRKVSERNGGSSCSLAEARRIWGWKGAGDCSELSLVGPRDGGQIGPVVSTEVHGVIEEYVAAPEAVAAVAKVAPWTR
jgi:hypothetical protein